MAKIVHSSAAARFTASANIAAQSVWALYTQTTHALIGTQTGLPSRDVWTFVFGEVQHIPIADTTTIDVSSATSTVNEIVSMGYSVSIASNVTVSKVAILKSVTFTQIQNKTVSPDCRLPALESASCDLRSDSANRYPRDRISRRVQPTSTRTDKL